MKPSMLHIFLVFIISSLLLLPSNAQFGIKKGVPISIPENGDDLGEDVGKQDGFLSEQDAADMSAIIEEAKKDLETMAMISKMKEGLFSVLPTFF